LALEGKLINLVRGDYILTFWVPAGFQFVKATTAAQYESVESSTSLVTVTLKLHKNKPLDWKLQFQRVEMDE